MQLRRVVRNFESLTDVQLYVEEVLQADTKAFEGNESLLLQDAEGGVYAVKTRGYAGVNYTYGVDKLSGGYSADFVVEGIPLKAQGTALWPLFCVVWEELPEAGSPLPVPAFKGKGFGSQDSGLQAVERNEGAERFMRTLEGREDGVYVGSSKSWTLPVIDGWVRVDTVQALYSVAGEVSRNLSYTSDVGGGYIMRGKGTRGKFPEYNVSVFDRLTFEDGMYVFTRGEDRRVYRGEQKLPLWLTGLRVRVSDLP